MVIVTTSGTWTGVSTPLTRMRGIDTKQLSWGDPYRPQNRQNKQSAYRFEGVTRARAPLDGTEFSLGTFTHSNFSIITSTPCFRVVLKLALRCGDSGPSQEFSFTFDHNETPNSPGLVPDEVMLPSPRSQETVTLDGTHYALHISGFRQNGNLVLKFISAEDRSNSAQLFAKLVAVPVKQISSPTPQPEKSAMTEETCRVKNVVDTGSLFAMTLERLNRQSVVHLLEQVVAEVDAQCEKISDGGGVHHVDLDKLRSEIFISINELRQTTQWHNAETDNLKLQLNTMQTTLHTNLPLIIQDQIQKSIHEDKMQRVSEQLELLNSKLIVIQQAAEKLDEGELQQVEILLVKLLQNVNLSHVVQNLSINIGERSFNLQYLLEILATVDRVSSIQIQYGEQDFWNITGARFVLTDLTQVVFQVRVLPDPSGTRIIYLFETKDWKGVPAHFRFVFNSRKITHKLCKKNVSADIFDGVEQTNVVFDLCSPATHYAKAVTAVI